MTVRALYIIVLLLVGAKIYFEAGNYISRNEFEKMEKNSSITDSQIRDLEEHKTLKSDGYDVHYYICGNDNTETIVFIHPAFSDHRAFDRQIEFFSKNYKTITIDLIGHGLSKANKSKDKIDESATHINRIIEIEKAGKIHLVGVSAGSLIAQYFSLKYPEKTESLISLGGYDINKENKEVEKAQRISNMGLIVKALFSMESFRKQTAKISTHTKNGELLFYNSSSLYERKSFMTMRGLQNIIKEREHEKLQYPVLILTGEYDIELAEKMAKEWHNTLDNSEFEIIKNAGHCANMDTPEDFNNLVMKFMNRNN